MACSRNAYCTIPSSAFTNDGGPLRLFLVALTLLRFAAAEVVAQNHALPPSTYSERRTVAFNRIGSDLLIVPARASFLLDDEMGYVQAPDFQYLTGLEHLVGAVLVLDGKVRSATLFAPRASRLITRWLVSPGPESAAALGLKEVLPIESLDEWITRRLKESSGRVSVASVDARGPVDTPIPMANSVARWRAHLQALGATTVESATSVLRPLREIKSPAEIEILRTVGKASGAAMIAGIRALRPGRWQRETEIAVVNGCAEAGARGVSFWPWTMSGPNAQFSELFSSFEDYDHLNRQMKRGEVVRVDVGCQLDHYMGDVGRTAPVGGKFDAGQREAWDLFIAGYRAGLPHIRDGASTKAVYDVALAEIRRRQPTLKTALGKKAAAVLLAPDGTEPWEIHGVGLDDAEGLPDTLHTGMVVAYELMYAVDGYGFYLEDMIAVGKDGPDLLTPGLPYTAAQIEAVMRRGTTKPTRP